MITADAMAKANSVEGDGIRLSVEQGPLGAHRCSAPRRRAAGRAGVITGVARMPCSTTDSAIVKPTVDHSQRSSGNVAAPAA